MRDLDRRWQSAAELLSELERVVAAVAEEPVAPSGSVPSSREDQNMLVFISYVRADRKRVKALVAQLGRAGISTWMDELQLEVGQRWQDVIRSAIRSAALFLAFFSKDGTTQERSYMREELALATEELRLRPRDRVWFIPVALDDVPLPNLAIGAGERLEHLQTARLYETGEAGIQRLIADLRKHLSNA